MDGNNVAPLTTKEILFSFTGRIGRKTYWLSFLAMIAFIVVIMFLLGLMGIGESATVIMLLLYIPIVWISLAIQVKRWHDRDKSGWWVLISFIPIIGPIWAFIENGLLAGSGEENRFGPPPF